MILQALTRYYDILLNDDESEIAPPGYSSVGVSFALEISGKGELLNMLPIFQNVVIGKKTFEKPQRMIVPEYAEPTVNVAASLLCGKSDYVLGISEKDDKKPAHSAKRFAEFCRLNKELLVQADCNSARAVVAFLDNHKPASARSHKSISPHLEEILKGRRIVFLFNGKYVHEDKVILQVWDKHRMGKDSVLGQCLVTGEISPIAIKHRKIQGIKNGQMAGNPMVSFNERAYESYNRFKGQGLNSPISEKAEFAYTTALNYLLLPTNENKKFYIGDTTVVYWAESEKKEYAKAFMGLCEPEMVEVEAPAEEESKLVINKKAEKRLKKVAEKVRRVQALDVKKILEDLKDENPRFYILGLAPNVARVSVRFFHSDPFDKIVEKIMKHYEDLEIDKEFEDQHTYLTIQDILRETMSKKASDPQASPLMAGSVFRAILDNAPYPAALFNAIINRIRADQDDSKKFIKKINYERAAIIKAYLLRKYRNQPQHPIQEVLVMSLNEQSAIPAYLLGRLFAVLEKVQKEAIPNLTTTIKDQYFTSACASPKTVFPLLLRHSQHNISKAEYGYASDNRIEKIMNLLDVEKNPFPSHLTLDEQGIFVLGYYHQRTAFYVKNSENSAESTSSETN
ncbi:MAG: type I-C CRISPR-associated protein Cas8c/Csd1 [Anaerolineales bacterium]|nr:type I-C CRISPR-associated protein Cas8c/Csd1 [Anaerolineales bacterium]